MLLYFASGMRPAVWTLSHVLWEITCGVQGTGVSQQFFKFQALLGLNLPIRLFLVLSIHQWHCSLRDVLSTDSL